MVDIRTMKQNALEHAPGGERAGAWLKLSSATFLTDKGASSPEVRVSATLAEVMPVGTTRAKNSDERTSFEENEIASPLLPGSDAAETAREVTGTAPVAAAAVQPEETPHLFTLTADVRSFKSTRRLPFPTASVVVKLALPAALLDAVSLGGKPRAAAATPVRTNPPAAVARASEAILQNGLGHVDFTAGVMTLASALAAGPRVAAEVWHKDAYAADALLGTATVSLAPLLREPTLDGYVPVMSDADPETPSAPRSALLLDSEAVKVGDLRVVLSLAEKGPAPSRVAPRSSATPADADAVDAAATTDLSSSVSAVRARAPGSARPERAPSAVVKASTLRASMERTAAAAVASREMAPSAQRASFEAGETGETRKAAPSFEAGAADSQASMDALRGGREYAVAWELEVWKQAQEAKWTASMRAREAERMAALEGEWRRREAQREAEHRRARDAAAATEKRLAGALAATQERERRLIAAEESLSVRREAERREMAQRMSEAQHAVRRLQQECEHQLEMEKGRAADVEQRAESLAERVEEANARAAAVERAFHGYKKAHLESSEASLHAEIATLQQRRADAERVARDAVESRDRFKTQIQKMAKQVVALERERTYLRANLSVTRGGDGEDENARPREPRILRGVAPPEPAPSAVDFATELFGGAGGDDDAPEREPDAFLRELRESAAALDAEARGDATAAAKNRRESQKKVLASSGEVPFVPEGVATRSPAKSREPSRSLAKSREPSRSLAKSREPSRSAAGARPGEGEKSAALDQLRSRRARAKASQEHEQISKTSAEGSQPEPSASPGSWSMESESGLKALFRSAREFEEERARAAGGDGDAKPTGGRADGSRTETATNASREDESEQTKPTIAAKAPITAASLAEKRALEKEVRRLVSERAELMATGAYSSSDRVIELIDEKIAEITAAVAKS